MPSKDDDIKFNESGVAKAWDANADSWSDRVRKGYDVFREYYNNPAMLAFIGDLKDRKVLDLGCGEGYQTRILARRGARMTGIDLSPRMIEFAREEERREPLGIRYEQASFTDLRIFADDSFDTVVSFMALMDGPGFADAMREVRRVLRPGAPLVFSIVHPMNTKGFGWVLDEQGEKIKFAVSEYFNEEPFVDRWNFSKAPDGDTAPLFTVPYFRKTMSDYLNIIIRAGLVVAELHEPRPTEEACRNYPWLRCWRDHAPLFLYVRATKPAR